MLKALKVLSSIRKQPRVCLVTIAIGEDYYMRYNRIFKPSQERYAAKVGYDFRIIGHFIDTSAQVQSLSSLQKALICELPWAQNYDYLLFVDADVIISPQAGPIHKYLDGSDRVGIVDEYSQPSVTRRLRIQKKNNWENSAKNYYSLHGFEILTTMVFNTGVMLLQPKIHRYQFADIYWSGREIARDHPRKFHYEQALIGYHLQISKNFQILDNSWNALWSLHKICDENELSLHEFAQQNHFIHFAGNTDVDLAHQIG